MCYHNPDNDTKMYFCSFDVKVLCNQFFVIRSAKVPKFLICSPFKISISSGWGSAKELIGFSGILKLKIQIGIVFDNLFAGFGLNHFNHGSEYQSTICHNVKGSFCSNPQRKR